MGPYDNRRITLDPGLTALALRGLAERDGHYPFLDRVTSRRLRRRRPASTVQSAPARAPFWPRSFRAAELFPTFSRLRGLRGPSSAAA
jgi:hypothetical protein